MKWVSLHLNVAPSLRISVRHWIGVHLLHLRVVVKVLVGLSFLARKIRFTFSSSEVLVASIWSLSVNVECVCKFNLHLKDNLTAQSTLAGRLIIPLGIFPVGPECPPNSCFGGERWDSRAHTSFERESK